MAIHVLLASATFIAALAYLYRPFLTRGLISGTWADPFIQIALLQNWSNCLSGYGSCLSPNFFYPFKGALGYNDGYLVSGLLFHGFRLLGVDALLSYELVYVVIRLVGFVSTIALGTRILKLPPWLAVAAAGLGMISINLLNQIEHTQLIYCAFVPLGLLLLIEALDRAALIDSSNDAKGTARRVAALIAGLGVLCAAWSLTAFYSFYFFMVFALLFFVAYALVRWAELKRAIRNVLAHPSLIAIVVMAAALTPLALWLVYGGTFHETGGHLWNNSGNPRLPDLFNVGPENPWSPVLAPIYRALTRAPMDYSERAVGFPPLLLICIVGSWVYLARVVWRMWRGESARLDHAASVALVLGLASLAMLVVLARVGAGYTLWFVFWKLLPGAGAIRLAARFVIFVTPVLWLVVAFVAAQIFRQASSRRAGVVAAGMIAALAIEQYNKNPVFWDDRQAQLAFFASIPPPPPECRSFYVSRPRYDPDSPGFDRYYSHSVDAMLIAALDRVPTLNGMASFQPRGWFLDSPFARDYEERVARYAREHGIADGLCSLDLKAKRWAKAKF
jgi:hypothetical protein